MEEIPNSISSFENLTNFVQFLSDQKIDWRIIVVILIGYLFLTQGSKKWRQKIAQNQTQQWLKEKANLTLDPREELFQKFQNL
jgi:hypothetical protein